MEDAKILMEKDTNFFKNLSWNNINWIKSYTSVRQLQSRIYRAQKANKKQKLRKLQKQLIDNPHSKCIAVAMASDIRKKKISQSEHIFISKLDKIKVAKNLDLTKRIRYVGKKSVKTLYQISKQCLLRLALDPEWENRFEDVCYGGRTSRTIYDSIDYLDSSMEPSDYIYMGNFKTQFERINCNVLLEKLDIHPMLKKALINFLKSKAFKLAQNKLETLIWCCEKPLLVNFLINISLYRLTSYISETIRKQFRELKFKPIVLLFYGYTYVIAHQSKSLITSFISEMTNFLINICPESSKLPLNHECYYGQFVFLGLQISPIKGNKPLYKVTASKESQQELIEIIRQTIRVNKSLSSYKLISKLTPYIFRWVSYFRYYVSKDALDKLDQVIHSQIKSWVFRRTGNRHKTKTKLKYFPKNKTYTFQGRSYEGEWILFGVDSSLGEVEKNNFLPKMKWMQSINYSNQFDYMSFYDIKFKR